MSPLQINILLHYYARCNDYRDGDFSAPAVAEAIEIFKLAKVFEPLDPSRYTNPDEVTKRFQLTKKGLGIVEKLCSVPIPLNKATAKKVFGLKARYW